MREQDYHVAWEEVSALLDKHTGIYDEPSRFEPDTHHTPDGPLMGNGTVLAYLSGKIPGDRERQTIYISRQDNFEDYKEDIDVHYVGYGGIDISRADGGKVSETAFCMEQDMKLAEVKGISESGFRTDTWLSARENIIISKITNLTEAPMTLDICVWTNVTDKVETGISSVAAGIDEACRVVYASRRTGSGIYGWSVNSTTAVRVLKHEISMEEMSDHCSKLTVKLAGNESTYMIAAVEGGRDAETDREDALRKVLQYESLQQIEAAREAHQQWWKAYWMKCYLELDGASESLEKVFYGYMYQIGCAIQSESEHPAEGVTAALFPWTGSAEPNWSGDYTLNTDVERPFIAAAIANRVSHVGRYTQVIKDFWETGVKNALDAQHLNWLIAGSGRKAFTKGIRGALYPTHIGPWGSRTEHFNGLKDYFCSPSNGTMVLQPLIQYYKLALDEGYLRETLYPMVRELANFWVDYAEPEEIDGAMQYNIYGATYEDTTAHKNATLDLAAARFMLSNAIAFSRHLGLDEELCRQWEEVHDHLAPYAVKNGYYIEDERGKEPVTVSCYNVYGFALFDLVGISSPREEKDRILSWLANRQEFGTDSKQIRAAVTAARVGFDPHIWLDEMKKGYVDCEPDDWAGIRPNNTNGDIGGTLFAQAIMEALMQSHEGFIHLFPAWYPEQKARFKNLRAYGAFLVSASQNIDGQVEGAIVHSEKGADCSVLNPWMKYGLGMSVRKGREGIEASVSTNSLGDVYTFHTEAGADYELVPDKSL